MGDKDSVTVSDNTKIEVTGEYDAFGIVIEGSGVKSSFGSTVIDVTSKIQTTDYNDVDGLKLWGADTEYSDLRLLPGLMGLILTVSAWLGIMTAARWPLVGICRLLQTAMELMLKA